MRLRHRAFLWLRNGLAVTLFVLCGACASVQSSHRKADRSAAASQVRTRLNEIFDAAQKKDFARLDSYHLYGPHFTKFSGPSFARQNATIARHGEHVGLGAVNDLQMRADDLRIDVFGDVAVATFVLDFSFRTPTGPVRKKERTTLVFVNDHRDWRIVHEHLSTATGN
jgi:ketosteroid isomerase-like protein